MKYAANMKASLSNLVVFYLNSIASTGTSSVCNLFPSISKARPLRGCGLEGKAEALRLESDTEGLFDIVAVLEEHVAGYNKELWFLRSMVA